MVRPVGVRPVVAVYHLRRGLMHVVIAIFHVRQVNIWRPVVRHVQPVQRIITVVVERTITVPVCKVVLHVQVAMAHLHLDRMLQLTVI